VINIIYISDKENTDAISASDEENTDKIYEAEDADKSKGAFNTAKQTRRKRKRISTRKRRRKILRALSRNEKLIGNLSNKFRRTFSFRKYFKAGKFKGNRKKRMIRWTIESIYTEDFAATMKSIREIKKQYDLIVIGAWEMDGRQVGMSFVLDDENGKVEITGKPSIKFKLSKYLKLCPDLTDINGNYITVSAALKSGDIKSPPQINVKANIQKPRDFNVY